MFAVLILYIVFKRKCYKLLLTWHLKFNWNECVFFSGRIRPIAPKPRSFCATSTKAVAMAASCTTFSTVFSLHLARNALSSLSHMVGGILQVAGKSTFYLSVTPVLTVLEGQRGRGAVRLNPSSFIKIFLWFAVKWSVLTFWWFFVVIVYIFSAFLLLSSDVVSLWCLSDNIDDVQVVEMPIVDSLYPRPPYMPQAIPRDLSERLIRLHGHSFVWWIGQFLKYLIRPQPALADDIEATRKRLHFKNPIVGYFGFINFWLNFMVFIISKICGHSSPSKIPNVD